MLRVLIDIENKNPTMLYKTCKAGYILTCIINYSPLTAYITDIMPVLRISYNCSLNTVHLKRMVGWRVNFSHTTNYVIK